MNRSISRSLILAGACIGGGLAIQPAYAEPGVRELVVQSVEVLIISSAVSGIALMVGAVAHQFTAWGRSLPPEAPSLPVQFADDQEAVYLAREEAQPDQGDAIYAWETSLLQFAFVGGRYGFSWRSIRRYVPNNADWKRGIEALTTSDPPVLMPARGNISPRWASGWYYSKLRLAVRWGQPPISLPPHPQERPLFVDWHRTARS